MSCLDMQEAPGRQAVGSVEAGRQQEATGIHHGSLLHKRREDTAFFLFYEEEKQGGDEKKGSREREAASPVVYRRAVLCYTKTSGWHSPSVKYEG